MIYNQGYETNYYKLVTPNYANQKYKAYDPT